MFANISTVILFFILVSSSLTKNKDGCKINELPCFRDEQCCSQHCIRRIPMLMAGDMAIMDLVRRTQCGEIFRPKKSSGRKRHPGLRER